MIYPNPADRFIHFDQLQETIMIHDMTGRLIMQQHNCHSIDVQQLPGGCYVISNTRLHTPVIIRR
jgi:hypothetical protein